LPRAPASLSLLSFSHRPLSTLDQGSPLSLHSSKVRRFVQFRHRLLLTSSSSFSQHCSSHRMTPPRRYLLPSLDTWRRMKITAPLMDAVCFFPVFSRNPHPRFISFFLFSASGMQPHFFCPGIFFRFCLYRRRWHAIFFPNCDPTAFPVVCASTSLFDITHDFHIFSIGERARCSPCGSFFVLSRARQVF